MLNLLLVLGMLLVLHTLDVLIIGVSFNDVIILTEKRVLDKISEMKITNKLTWKADHL